MLDGYAGIVDMLLGGLGDTPLANVQAATMDDENTALHLAAQGTGLCHAVDRSLTSIVWDD